MIEVLFKLVGYYLATPKDDSLSPFYFTITRDGYLVSCVEMDVHGQVRITPMRLRCEVIEAGVLATHSLDKNNKEVVHQRMNFTISEDGCVTFVKGENQWSCRRIVESDMPESVFEMLQFGVARSRENPA